MTTTPAASNTVGARVKQRRRELGITAIDLARRAGMSRGYLSTIESGKRGNPGAAILQRIATALGTSVPDLLGYAPARRDDTPAALRALAERRGLPAETVVMLAAIQYRGRQPANEADYWYIYESIRRTIGGAG